MGRRGPPPKPTAVRVLEGNAGKRPLNRREPKPPAGMPPMPSWLPVRARPFWPRVTRLLEPLHVVTTSDELAIGMMADAWAEWHDAAKGKGKPGVGDKAMRRLLTLANRFGLTPADRTRLVARPVEDEDPLDELRERRNRKTRQART